MKKGDPACKFSPLLQRCRRRAGHSLKQGLGRVPPREKTRSPPWSFCALAPALEEGQEVPKGLRCSSRPQSRGQQPTLRWSEGWKTRTAGFDCSKWELWEWGSQRCWGCRFWKPVPHLRSSDDSALHQGKLPYSGTHRWHNQISATLINWAVLVDLS